MKSKICLLVIICLTATYSCKSKRHAAQTHESATAANVSIVDGRAVISQETPPVEAIEVFVADNITVRTESVSLVDRPALETMFRFYVIIGSFREIANARQYKDELENKGFTPVVLASELGLFRVSVGGFDVENSARVQIAEIRANHEEHSDVWLLVRK